MSLIISAVRTKLRLMCGCRGNVCMAGRCSYAGNCLCASNVSRSLPPVRAGVSVLALISIMC